MSDVLIPVSDRSVYLSRVFYGTTITLLVLCIPTLSTRVYLKTRPWRLGLDDLFIIVGFVSVSKRFVSVDIDKR